MCLPGFQSSPARPPLSGPIHAAATVRDGVSEGEFVQQSQQQRSAMLEFLNFDFQKAATTAFSL